MTRCFLYNRDNAFPLDKSSIDQMVRQAGELPLIPGTAAPQFQLSAFLQVPEEYSAEALQQIAHDSITGALEYLNRVENVIPSLAMDFRDTPGPEAFQNLLQLYEVLYRITVLADKLTAYFRVSLEEAMIRGTPLLEHRQDFISILKRLIVAQERKEFTGIPDLLEGDIAALVPVWKEMLLIVRKRVSSAESLCQSPVNAGF